MIGRQFLKWKRNIWTVRCWLLCWRVVARVCTVFIVCCLHVWHALLKCCFSFVCFVFLCIVLVCFCLFCLLLVCLLLFGLVRFVCCYVFFWFSLGCFGLFTFGLLSCVIYLFFYFLLCPIFVFFWFALLSFGFLLCPLPAENANIHRCAIKARNIFLRTNVCVTSAHETGTDFLRYFLIFPVLSVASLIWASATIGALMVGPSITIDLSISIFNLRGHLFFAHLAYYTALSVQHGIYICWFCCRACWWSCRVRDATCFSFSFLMCTSVHAYP